MKLLLCLSFLLASNSWAADEAADRAAIDKVVSTLNSSPDSPGLFTDDFSDNAALTTLGVHRYRVPAITPDTAHVTTPDGQPTIHLDAIHMCVSHEPWGEWDVCPPVSALPITTSRLAIQSVRLLTPDVALVDAVNEREVGGQSRKSPVLLVLHKEGDVWKIASLRVIAPSRPPVAQ